jgi:PhzF family phenazine biosynthesis protein
MSRRQWSIDALASAPFKGNPACVLEPFDAFPEVGWMQALAAENAAGATAYLTRTAEPARFGLRWFAPRQELPLCGHGTFAAAHVLFAELGLTAEQLVFETGAGDLSVRRVDDGYQVAFPAAASSPIEAPAGLAEALGASPVGVFAGPSLAVLLEDEASVRRIEPDLAAIRAISAQATGGAGNLGVAALVAEGPYQVVSRYFAPGYGLTEDPATGSWHCLLAPLMSARLGRDRFRYHQAFPGRGADMVCEVEGASVHLTAPAVTISEGRLRFAT